MVFWTNKWTTERKREEKETVLEPMCTIWRVLQEDTNRKRCSFILMKAEKCTLLIAVLCRL